MVCVLLQRGKRCHMLSVSDLGNPNFMHAFVLPKVESHTSTLFGSYLLELAAWMSEETHANTWYGNLRSRMRLA